MSRELDFAKVKAARKSWTPIQPTAYEKATEGAESVISRCLALKLLELPVKEFILDGISRDEISKIGTEGIEALLRNVQDEEKHDLALSNCLAVYKEFDENDYREAQNITDAWVTHPDHPITKAAVLENAIFFVVLPLYRTFGGDALRMTSMDISFDEILHVRLHRHVAQVLGHRPNKSLDELRKQTVRWFLEMFEVPGYTREQFYKASDDLMYRGITKELDFTQSFQVPAFFERATSTLPSYS